MKHREVFRKIKIAALVLIVLSFILYTINWYFSSNSNNLLRYKGPANYSLNQRETKIIDSIKKLGYKEMRIYKPIMGLEHPYGNNYYVVNLRTNKFAKKDSVFNFSKSLAKELYKNRMSDRFIFDIEYIYINYKFCKNSNDTINCEEKEFRFYKDSLEKWCGFKVVSTGSDYKRLKMHSDQE